MTEQVLKRLQANALETFSEFEDIFPKVSLLIASPGTSTIESVGRTFSNLQITGEPSSAGVWVSRSVEQTFRIAVRDHVESHASVLSAHISLPSIEGHIWNDSSAGWDCHQIGYVILEFEGNELHHEKDFFTHLSGVFLNACLGVVRRESEGRSPGELRREAGRKMLESLTKPFQTSDVFGFFEAFNKISALKYEGEIISGEIVFIENDSKPDNYLFGFESPISLNDIRKVRKLFELSDPGESSLVLTKNGIVGVGETDLIAAQRDASFSVEFNGHHKWELWKDGCSLMVVEFGLPRLKRKLVSKKEFTKLTKKAFDKIADEQIEKLWRVTVEAIKQEHGTMLVISDEAESEAERLRAQSFKLSNPVDLWNKLGEAKNAMNIVNHVTSIDGAVLLDRDCICHAIGVILDGVVCELSGGDSSRGARYNSALRYRQYRTNGTDTDCNLAIIVVSEDGTIDIL